MKNNERITEIKEYIQALCRENTVSHQEFVQERNERIMQETMKRFQISREEAGEYFLNRST